MNNWKIKTAANVHFNGQSFYRIGTEINDRTLTTPAQLLAISHAGVPLSNKGIDRGSQKVKHAVSA